MLGLYVNVFSGLTLVNFEDTLAIFVKVSYEKGPKSLHILIVFYCINSYLATKKSLLLGKLVDNHKGLVWAKFGVTAVISTGISSLLEPKKNSFF